MRRRILLADDSVTIQKVIELTFLDEDYEVRAVSNGDEAIAALPEVRPDFVIADIHMPGANGYEVCRRAKQLQPGVPVLLLVGTFEPFDEGQAHNAGADSFLKKPFDSQELLQRVEELLAATPAPAPAVEEPSPAFAEWSGFEVEAEPEPLSFAASGAEPFDREPSFDLGPAPSFSLQNEEPVFALEDEAGGFTLRDEVGAPEDLSLGEPQDRYLEPEPAGAPAGFTWSEPASQPEPSPAWAAPAAAFTPAAEAVEEVPPSPVSTPAANGGGRLSDEDVDRIARRVVELLGDRTVRDVAWEVIPDLAEVIIRDRLRELEGQVDLA
jgi:CheY-like chemotaxis protein